MNLFPKMDFSPTLIERYNSQSVFEFERIRDFLILHYHATERSDTPFWEHCRTMSIPEPLKETIRLFKDSGRFYRNADELFVLTSWVQVMLGQRIVPQTYHPLVDQMTGPQLEEFVNGVRKVVASCVEVMPTHAQFIARHCQAPKIMM
jgi:tryptophan halogenase